MKSDPIAYIAVTASTASTRAFTGHSQARIVLLMPGNPAEQQAKAPEESLSAAVANWPQPPAKEIK